MKINYKELDEKIMPNFQGGEKYLAAHIFNDGQVKILAKAKLVPGASIGLHKHETSSEIILVLSGKGRMICENKEEILEPMDVHYCAKGQSHTFINDGEEDLIFFAVVPQQ